MSDVWQPLKRYTQARIALGCCGVAIPTDVHLELQMAHALARDAVHLPWPIDDFSEALAKQSLPYIRLSTAVNSRQQYLLRPDLGRRLHPLSRQQLQGTVQGYDVVLIVSDGLSSTAASLHGLPLLNALLEAFRSAALSVGPICLVANARVALSDEIGDLLGARLAVMVIGERPGLSAADSLGLYMTYQPRIGRSDAERNCISNIRPPLGLDYAAAARKLLYLGNQALSLGYSGVELKDDMPHADTGLQTSEPLPLR